MILKFNGMLLLLASLFLVPSSSLHAQAWSGILDSHRAIDWSQSGIPGGIPNRTAICATINATTYGNGSADATSGIQGALNACQSGQVVSLSAGTFLINRNLSIPSNVTLRGQGANQTVLNAKGTSGAVITFGSGFPSAGNSVPITTGATQGSTSITVGSSSGIVVGSYLMITELNDPTFVSIAGSSGACTWCDGGIGWNGTRALGQIVEVASVNGNTISISPALYVSYTLTPLATPFTAATKNAGVEALQVYANQTGYTSTFYMTRTAYCWIKGVEDNYTDGDHVRADWSYRGEIRDNYFSNAYTHSPGQADSDVVLRDKTSGFLVENNIFERLHASIMLEWGSAGNVIAYNYLFGNFGTGLNMLFPGLDMHGAHPMFNLYEGNIDFKYEPDSVWGSSSHNTAFRNWEKGTTKICSPQSGRGPVSCSGTNGFYAFQANRAMDIDFLGSNYNLVGDVVGSTEMANLKISAGSTPMPSVDRVVGVCGPSPCGPGSRSYGGAFYAYSLGFGASSDDGTTGFDSLVPYTTLFLHGEYSNVTGTTTWAKGVTQLLPASFYLTAKPAWFGSVPWPAIGPDVTGGIGPGGHAYAIPAEVCYENVMGGTDGTGSPLSFNANACYSGSSASAPNPPTGLTAVVQ